MGSDKPHKNISHNEFYHNDKSVFISFDIKYVMLVPYIVSGRKVSFQVSQSVTLNVLFTRRLYLWLLLFPYWRGEPS